MGRGHAVDRHSDELCALPIKGERVSSAFAQLTRPGWKIQEWKRGGCSHLDIVRHAVEVGIAPALVAPGGNEGSADAGVEGYEAAVAAPEVAVAQDLTEGAQVKAHVGPADDTDIVQRWDPVRRVGLSVEDEDEVRRPVQALVQEEDQVPPRVLRLFVCVQDQGAL